MRYAVAILATVLLAGCSSGGGTPAGAPSSPAGPMIRSQGAVTLLPRSDFAADPHGTSCHGTGRYADLRRGVNVTISDDLGRTLQVTHVVSSGLVGPGASSGAGVVHCALYFPVAVPAGKRFYGVALGRRSAEKVPEKRLARGVQFTIIG